MKKMFLIALVALCSTSFGYDIPQSLIDCKANCINERGCNNEISPKGWSHCMHSCDGYCTSPRPTIPTPKHPTPIKPTPKHPIPMHPGGVN